VVPVPGHPEALPCRLPLHTGRCTCDVRFRDLADLLIGCIGGIQKGQAETGSRLESLGVTEHWNNDHLRAGTDPFLVKGLNAEIISFSPWFSPNFRTSEIHCRKLIRQIQRKEIGLYTQFFDYFINLGLV
jgi:hypothetical protein